MADKVTVDMTTGIGTISFPHLFKETVAKKDDGSDSYEVQFIIPKSDKATVRAVLSGIKKVAEAKWGDNWRKVKSPLRDGDKEAGDLTEDGSTKGEKYPERNGCFFINARSTKPVGVVGRDLSPITDADAVYGGCKAKVSISLYPYSNSGNHGVGCGLNGVQKISDGEPLGTARPSVESMFDLLDDEEPDLDGDFGDEVEDEEPEEAPAPAKKAAAKKAPAKKAAAAAPVEEDDEDDLYADLDDI